jgi:tetratricopeptide (TPR) repeat protein
MGVPIRGVSTRRKHDEAVTALRAAIKHTNEPIATLSFNLGVSLRELDRWDHAVDAFRDACHLDRDNRDYLAELAMSLMRAGHLDEAMASFGRAVSIRPTAEGIHG